MIKTVISHPTHSVPGTIPLIFFFLILTACQPAAVVTPTSTALPPSPTRTELPPTSTPTAVSSPTPNPLPTETPSPAATPTERPTPFARDLHGIWERISNEHGNEYLFFGEEGRFVYAEGNVANVEDNPTITGNYLFDNGIFTITTEDCPDIPGTYTIRLIANNHLRFELVADICEGREDGLTFQPWQRFSDY